MRDLSTQPFYGLIKEYTHWVVLFREKQVTPGSVIIMDKTVAARSLGEVGPEAWAEFGVVSSEIEGWLQQAFGAEKFNYLALMMKDPEVHFHVVPRYSQPVEIDGHEYIDKDWPLKTELQAIDMDESELESIKQKILEVVA